MQRITCYFLYLYVLVSVGSAMSFEGAIGSLERVIGLPLLLLWIGLLVKRKSLRVPPVLYLCCLLFYLWNATSLLWSIDPPATVYNVYRYTLIFGGLLIIWDMARTREEADNCLQAFVFGGYFLIASMMQNAMSGVHLDNYVDRFTGAGFNPNDPGKIFAMSMPIAWYLGILKEKQHSLLRVVNAVYPLFCIFAVLLSGSRGGLIACIPALIFIMLNLKKIPLAGRIILALLAVGAIGAMSWVDLGPQMERFSTIASSASDDKLSGREEIWAAGWNVFTHNPIFGVGAGAFPDAILSQTVAYQGLVAHNTFLSVATETGFVGFCLFIVILFLVIRDVHVSGRYLRGVWISSLVGLLIAISDSAWEIHPHPWLLMILIVTRNRVGRLQYPLRRDAANFSRLVSEQRIEPAAISSNP